MRGRPSCLLQSAGGEANRILLASALIITDLYSAFRSEDTEVLDAAQEDYLSLNRWVLKWRLKVRMFSHSRISAGREFQVDGAATEKAQWASSVCMSGTTSIGRPQSLRWCTGLYQLAEIRWSGCGPHLVSQYQYSQFIGDPLPHRKPL